MQIIRYLGWTIPVANLSMPDIIHPILETRGLAPTIGLGNVSILHLRILAAWKHRHQAAVSCEQPLIRVVGHHRQVYDVMQSTPPHDDRYKVQVYVGNDGERDDDLAYLGEPFPPSPIYNTITAASTLPVLGALLPGSKPRRFSAPAPFGLPGGYPVKIAHGNVALDLPDGADLASLTEYNQRLGKLDGVEKIETDGMVHFTETTQSAIRELDPGLAEPLDPWDLKDRTDRLQMIIREMGPI